MSKVLLLTLFATFVMLFANLAIFASVQEQGIFFENQNYTIDLANGNVNANFTVVNNLQNPVVFGYFTFYSSSLPSNVQIYIDGKLADNKYIHLSSYSGKEKYTTITYDHLWQPLSPGQSMNISLKYRTTFPEQGVLFKEIEIVPGKFSFKNFSSVPVKAAVLTVKTPNQITYNNYPEFEISSDENSIIWQDNGSQRRYVIEYSVLPFFKNNIVPGYFVFWLGVFFVIVVGLYLYEKRAPKGFIDVEDILNKEHKATKKPFKKRSTKHKK